MMNAVGLRAKARSMIRARINRKVVWRDEGDLGRAAVVFAPHPDDETLGCGGTVIRKRKLGADVIIVVMTDGSGSHRHFMDESRLREIRAAEAVEAARRLGVSKEHVYFLDFPDRGLEGDVPEGISRVKEILNSVGPAEIYVPYEHEPPADHVVTRRIALDAAAGLGGLHIYEYPVWFWFHWPWVPYPLNNRRDLPKIVRDNIVCIRRMLDHFTVAVDIGGVVEDKKKALDAYESQMTRLVDDPEWARLEDVADGEFLLRFFERFELFRESVVAGNG